MIMTVGAAGRARGGIPSDTRLREHVRVFPPFHLGVGRESFLLLTAIQQ